LERPGLAALSEIRQRRQSIEALLAQAERLSQVRRGGTISDFRARDAARKNTVLEAKKALWIPEPEDRARRAQLEASPFEWLAWYFHDIFREPFQEHHMEMVLAIERATVYGGYQAISASIRTSTSLLVTLAVYTPPILTSLFFIARLLSKQGLESDATRIAHPHRSQLFEETSSRIHSKSTGWL
jgi:hypothetical protein